MMEELYARYGKLLVQLEIIQGQVNDCKRAIAEKLNEKPATVETK